MGAILAAEIEYQSHTDTRRDFGVMFGGATEADMPGGYALGAEKLRLTAHAGTHVDAPWHYYPTSEGRPARTIDQIELEHLFAPGVVVDLRGREPGHRVDADELAAAVEATGAPLAPGEIVCLRFGQDEHFGTPRYWDDYAGLGPSRSSGCRHDADRPARARPARRLPRGAARSPIESRRSRRPPRPARWSACDVSSTTPGCPTTSSPSARRST